jgi:flagellar assembly factor FliW
LIFFCISAKPLLFVVVDIGEGQQQRHHSFKAPISNALPIIIASPFFMQVRKYLRVDHQSYSKLEIKKEKKKKNKNIIIMEKRRYKKERKATSKHMKKNKSKHAW